MDAKHAVKWGGICVLDMGMAIELTLFSEIALKLSKVLHSRVVPPPNPLQKANTHTT